MEKDFDQESYKQIKGSDEFGVLRLLLQVLE